VNDKDRTDLPQPGLDEEQDATEPAAGDDPTKGPGNVSVDEPTDTSLDPESEHEDWP
jgi:hypothetical protein